jgi:hypothetical protein
MHRAAAAAALLLLPLGAAAQEPPADAPPLGKYVCRQGMTTINYHTLSSPGAYEVGGVAGSYAYDPATGEVQWQSGSYADWNYTGLYAHRTAASLGRAEDEHIIRLTDPTGALRVDCFLMADG